MGRTLKAPVTTKEVVKAEAVPAKAPKTKELKAKAPAVVAPAKAEKPAPKVEKPSVVPANKKGTVVPIPESKKPAPAPKAEEKSAKKQSPALKDDDGEMSWDDMFEEVIESKTARYIRKDDFTLEELTKLVPKQNVHMLMAENREDEKFSNMVLIHVSTHNLTFIDQTGGENMDDVLQRPHDQIIGKKSLIDIQRNKSYEFPFALYVREPKRGSK